ncbi:MAG: 50S ribosomal protein L13, partial [Deltaproteobacteria bacterium]|nr:50S ribosomal protein L13 [Deltaproteobacteria bacterium]
EKKWYVVDAEGKTLGRLATDVATVLRGKHKPTYTPSMDMGDFVVITSAGKIGVTGDKLAQKKYYRHSGYPGAIKETTLEKLITDKPEEALRKAVKGMLPSGPLGRAMFKKLKVYAEAEHPHIGQKPEPFPSLHKGAVA